MFLPVSSTGRIKPLIIVSSNCLPAFRSPQATQGYAANSVAGPATSTPEFYLERLMPTASVPALQLPDHPPLPLVSTMLIFYFYEPGFFRNIVSVKPHGICLCNWLVSLRLVFSRFIHVVTGVFPA